MNNWYTTTTTTTTKNETIDYRNYIRTSPEHGFVEEYFVFDGLFRVEHFSAIAALWRPSIVCAVVVVVGVAVAVTIAVQVGAGDDDAASCAVGQRAFLCGAVVLVERMVLLRR